MAVRAHQEPFDERYDTNNNCQVCSLGGSLVCCTFCNLVYHPTCIPAMQAHKPVAVFVCVKCFGDTFPAQKKLYKRVLFDLECPLPASPWPNIACSDTIAAQSAGADLRAAQEALTVAVDAGAHTTLIAPADAAAGGNVGALAGGTAAGHGGADDVIAGVDTLADTIVADDSERLLDQAILRAQQEGKSFPYTVLTSFGESPLPMVRGYGNQLCIDRATRHPLWFATLVQLRALQARIDDLSVGAHQSPRPIREPHFAGAAVLQST